MSRGRVLVTGSNPARLGEALTVAGWRAVPIPMIEIRAIETADLDHAIDRLHDYTWVVITSPNGARAVLDRVNSRRAGVPENLRWAAVGPATRAVIERRGVTVSAEPAGQTGAAIAEELGALVGARILLARSDRADRRLPERLAVSGAVIDDVPVYSTIEGPETSRAPLARALARGVDAAIFTSESTVRGIQRLVEHASSALAGVPIIAIGPPTARAVNHAGLRVSAMAGNRTPEGIVEALERATGTAC